MKARGTELHLLLAARLTGSDEYWKYKPRVRVVAPDRIVVRVNYTDRSKQDSIPFHRQSSEHGLYQGVGAYIVPLHENRTVESVELIEGMSFGQVFLLAATLRTQGRTEGVDPIAAKPNPVFAEVPPLADIPVVLSGNGEYAFGFGSPNFYASLNVLNGWHLWRLKANCLTPASQELGGIRLFRVTVGEETLENWEMRSYKDNMRPNSDDQNVRIQIQAVGKDNQGREIAEVDCTLTYGARGELIYETTSSRCRSMRLLSNRCSSRNASRTTSISYLRVARF